MYELYYNEPYYYNFNPMVKFFLPEAREQQRRPKKDYRKIIYKQLLIVIRTKHLKYMSKAVQAIKDAPEQSEKVSHLEDLKKIKKSQMKISVLYIMAKILSINNLSALESDAHMKDLSSSRIVEEVEGNQGLKNFIEQVMKSQKYKDTIEKLGEFCDEISKKKHQTKEKLKQRKTKKKIKQRGLKEEGNVKQGQEEDNQDVINSDLFPGNEDSSEKQVKKNQQTEKEQFFMEADESESEEGEPKRNLQQRKQKNERNNFVKKEKKISKSTFERESKNQSRRTEFVKKGRNKVKDEKKKKKQNFKQFKSQKSKEDKIKGPDKKNSDQSSKAPLHPSWAAKKQEKVFIKEAFQGKKILL